MKKYLSVLLLMMMTTGCGWFGGGPLPPTIPPIAGEPGQPIQKNIVKQQLAAGKASFEEKLDDSIGLNRSGLLKKWGKMEPRVSHAGLTVYPWRQTANLMMPKYQSRNSGVAPQTASCLVMFIVGPNNEVIDANAKGQCFDYTLMPALEPIITQSTDGKIGTLKSL